MKIFISTLMAFLFITNSSFAFFNDVPETHQYYSQIKKLYHSNKLPTYSDNNFNPDALADSADLYELILSYGNVPADELTDDEIITKAADIGLIGKNETINTSVKVTKYTVLKTLFESLGIGIDYFFSKSNFNFQDVNVDSYIAPVADKAEDVGILEGNPAIFQMAKRITRGELADYLYKINEYSPFANISSEINTSVEDIAPQYKATEKDLLENDDFLIFLDIWKNLHEDYFYKDEIDDEELIKGAINGLVGTLDDPYTTYEDVEEAMNFKSNLSGEYEGVGMYLEMIDENITIISPFKDSPAEKAGLKANDIIIGVDGTDVSGQSVAEVSSKIMGAAGTTVKIKILRDKKEMEFTVTRELVSYNSVESEMLEENGKKIGYIDMALFTAQGDEDFKEAAEALIAENPDGFIIDLRNNPGGYLTTAINIFSLFTDKKETVIETEYEDGTKETYLSNGDGILKDYEIVVLINGGSASSSEILAGALKDYDYAKLIGEKSFGKGSVQQIVNYFDGSLFKYTIAKWLTPKGTDIGATGITPDKTIKNTEEKDLQLEAAIEEF